MTKTQAPPSAPKRTVAIVKQELQAAIKARSAALNAQDEEMLTSKIRMYLEEHLSGNGDAADPDEVESRLREGLGDPELQQKGWLAYAESIYAKFFTEYPKIKELIDRSHHQITTRKWVEHPLHRRRTMFRVLTQQGRFIADAKRRSVNAPPQGVSSEGGLIAAYLILKEVDMFLKRWDLPENRFTIYCRAVHDANYSEEALSMMLPAIHIQQHCATVGVGKHLKKHFNYTPLLLPEVEIAIGTNGADMESWDWRLVDLPPEKEGDKPAPGLVTMILNLIDEMIALKKFRADQREALIDMVFDWWIDAEKREYMLTTYPLLQVPDLDAQVVLACKQKGIVCQPKKKPVKKK